MKLVPIGTVIFRILSIGWFLNVAEAASYLPADLMGIAYHRGSGYFAEQYIIDFLARVIRLVADLVVGLLFLFRSERLAQWACKGLEKYLDPSSTGMWPPAPQMEGPRIDGTPSGP